MTKNNNTAPIPKASIVTQEPTMDLALLAWSKSKPICEKNGTANYGSYSTLEDVIKCVDKAAAYGLTFVQENNFERDPHGNLDEFIITRMIHSATSTERVGRTLVKIKGAAIDNPQQMGSGITYAKRYGLQAMFGLASDDDGNLAAGDASANNSVSSRKGKAIPKVSQSPNPFQ